MEEKDLNGCLWLGAKDTDYKLTEWLLDSLPTLYPQDEKIYEYNQYNQKWSQKSCTIFSPIGAISDLFNVEIPLDTVKIWDNDTYSKGRMKDSGWYVALGVEHIKDEWNKSDFAKKYGKVAFYSIDFKDDTLVKKILDKRYTICTGYQWNATYNNDKNKDWVLNWTSFWTATYGHAVNAIRGLKTPSRIKDNYAGTNKYNIYAVEHEFSDLWCFYDRWYIFTKVAEDNLWEIKRLNELKTECENAIEKLSNIYHLVNDDNFKWVMHNTADKLRAKIKTCEEMLGKLM